jgi:hypothetical protein
MHVLNRLSPTPTRLSNPTTPAHASSLHPPHSTCLSPATPPHESLTQAHLTRPLTPAHSTPRYGGHAVGPNRQLCLFSRRRSARRDSRRLRSTHHNRSRSRCPLARYRPARRPGDGTPTLIDPRLSAHTTHTTHTAHAHARTHGLTLALLCDSSSSLSSKSSSAVRTAERLISSSNGKATAKNTTRGNHTATSTRTW